MYNVKFEDFSKYYKSLLRASLNMTKSYNGISWQYNKCLAEDVVQESYIKFHKMIESNFEFKNENHLKQLLVKNIWRISKDTKYNTKGVKYKSKEDKIDIDLLPENLHMYINPIVYSKLNVEHIFNIIKSLKKSIGGSSKKQITDSKGIKEMFLYIEGYNIKEISKNLNKTDRAVTSSISRNKKYIRKIIDKNSKIND